MVNFSSSNLSEFHLSQTSSIQNNISIEKISAFECLDSRGFPTISVSVLLSDGTCGKAMVPSGASTGEHEAHELRDGDNSRYLGKGTLKAVNNVNTVCAKALLKRSPYDIAFIDKILIDLDGTETKAKLGANAILGISLACAQAAATSLKVPLFFFLGGLQACRMPLPLVNVINGGAHATNSLDFQEFMIVPHKSHRFSENLRVATEVFHTLKKNLKKKGLSTGLGDEGGFAPDLASSREAIICLVEAINDAGFILGKDVSIALDVAASEFYDKTTGKYVFKKSSKEQLSVKDMIAMYQSWIKEFPLVSIEDGLDENDWDGWSQLTKDLGSQVQLVGDDLFVTNKKRVQEGITKKIGNAVLVKVNQIGSLSETLETVDLAHRNGFKTIISHRSGETEDTAIADLAVALGSGQIKTGSISRSERIAKYNRLLWIEKVLGDRAYCIDPFSIDPFSIDPSNHSFKG
jgi:enolase